MPSPSLTEAPCLYSPRTVAGLVRRAERVEVAVPLDGAAGTVALVPLSRAAARRLVRAQYGRGRKIECCLILGALVIGAL